MPGLMRAFNSLVSDACIKVAARLLTLNWVNWLIRMGVLVVSVVDGQVATGLSPFIQAPQHTQKKIRHMSDSVSTPTPQNNIQHFYLRLDTKGQVTKHGTPIPPNFRGAPVGVIAFRNAEVPGKVVVSGTMVSRKDQFERKDGVARARGRLFSSDKNLVVNRDEFLDTSSHRLCIDLGLYSRTGNHFTSVNWARADKTKASALESFEARQAQVPA